MEKLEWCGYPMVKKILRCLFVLTECMNGHTHRSQTDTDGHRMTAKAELA